MAMPLLCRLPAAVIATLLRAAMLALVFHCQASTAAADMTDPARIEFPHLAWSRQASIYEVNVRQFTPEGTLKAAEAHLPRLKALGVDIVWLMPVQPIGVKERKGSLGSYYSIRDYTAVNPEFGTLDDFRHFVDAAHALGLRVLLDWVANHTAWDSLWAAGHPEWFQKNAAGLLYPVTFREGTPSVEYWTDVIGLDYRQRALWPAMTEAMAFWLRETALDGFRCDVAELVPTAFWNQARAALDAIRPVFMLAEGAAPGLHEHAFDMTYDWDLWDTMVRIARGHGDARDLRAYLERSRSKYPPDAYRMLFTSNHDKNSWDGSDTELYGPAFKAMTVLTMTLPGMPLIYGGQESGLDKRLAFFEKDPVAWKHYELAPFYNELLRFRRANPALANGVQGGPAEVVATGNDAVFAFRRAKGANRVLVMVNLGAQPQAVTLPGERQAHLLGPWGFEFRTE